MDVFRCIPGPESPESPESLTASWPLMTVAARTTENKDCPLSLHFASSILLMKVGIPR